MLNFSVSLFKFEAKCSKKVALSDYDHSLLWNELLYRHYSGQLRAQSQGEDPLQSNTEAHTLAGQES